MLRRLLSAVVAVAFCPTASAAPHRYVLHPNPALTILSITQGPDGWLWLAAEEGLYRFDGLHFDKIPDYPFGSARFVAFTSDGSMWVGGRDGLVRRRDRFEVIAREEVRGMTALADQVWFKSDRLTQVRADGSIHRFPYATREQITADSSGRLFFACGGRKFACWIAPDKPLQRNVLEIPDGYDQVARDGLGRIWIADGASARLLHVQKPASDLRRTPSQRTARAGPLLPGRNGQLWFLGETVRGTTPQIAFRDSPDNERFQPTAGYEDGHRHVWVSLLGRGLTEWIPDPVWERWYREDFGGAAPSQIVRTYDGTLVAATQAGLFRFDTNAGTWTRFGEPHNYAALLPLPEGGFLASIRNVGLARLSTAAEILELPHDPLGSVDQYRKIVRDRSGRMWVGNKLGLLRITGQPGALRLTPETLPLPPSDYLNAVDLELDAQGRLWAGYDSGIAWLDEDGSWHQLPTSHALSQVRSITLAAPSGEEIWVAYRRGGRFSRLQKHGDRWRVTDFEAAQGYGPPDTHFIRKDSRGWIWRGSPDGLQISDGRHVAPGDWLHIGPDRGLAAETTGQYGFFEDSDGSVWISGESGVTHLRPEASWFDAPGQAPAPRITRLECGDRVSLRTSVLPGALPLTDKLRIQVGSLDTPLFRPYPFRYRLRPVMTKWGLSRDGVLEFLDLPPADYTLEVGYTGNGPSAMLRSSFRIGPAAAGYRAWRWLIPLGLAAMLVFFRGSLWFEKFRYRLYKAIFLARRFLGQRILGRRDRLSVVSGEQLYRDHTGDTLSGRYRVIRQISHGNLSVVYEARDLQDGGTRTAVKVLKPAPGQDSWMRDRFAREIAALRSVEHPGVVRILDSWVSPEGEPCIALPFLEGPTMRSVLRSGPMAPSRVARIVRSLGAALSEVHRKGIVHRDLKPENVVLLHPNTAQEQSVIIDFDTSGIRGRASQPAVTTMLAGSFHYMAPERLSGRYSTASDVYAFAVMILEMLTGRRLADLNALFHEPAFPRAVEELLTNQVGRVEAARVVTECLLPAYDPDPQNRPVDLLLWSERLAKVLS